MRGSDLVEAIGGSTRNMDGVQMLKFVTGTLFLGVDGGKAYRVTFASMGGALGSFLMIADKMN